MRHLNGFFAPLIRERHMWGSGLILIPSVYLEVENEDFEVVSIAILR